MYRISNLQKLSSSLFLISIVLISSFTFLNIGFLYSQPITISKTDNIQEIAQADTFYGYFNEITGEDDLVIVTTYDSFYIFNCSDSANPYIQLELPFPEINDVILKNGTLYILQNNSFQIYSLFNNSLSLLDTISFPKSCNKIILQDNLAYITNRGNMSIVEISDPTNITLLSDFYVANYLKDFCINNNYLYFLNSESNIIVKNITDISHPTTAMIYFCYEMYINDIEIDNGLLYIANSTENKLDIYNCTTPNIFEYLSSVEGIQCRSMNAQGNSLFVLGSQDLQIINITDIMNPSILVNESIFSTSLSQKENYIVNTNLYITDGLNGLLVVDFSNITHPLMTANFESGGNAWRILKQDDYLFLANNLEGVEILSMDEENIIEQITFYKDNDHEEYNYYDVLIINDLFYVSTHSDAIIILEMLENNSLIRVGEYEEPFANIGQMITNDRYIFANMGGNIVVLDTANSYNPRKINSFFDGMAIHDMVIEDDLLFVLFTRGFEQGVRVYDVSNPLDFKLVTTYNFVDSAYFSKMTVHDDLLIITAFSSLLLFDIKKSGAIQKISENYLDPFNVFSIFCGDNTICLGTNEGISILDISDKNNPNKIAYYYDGGMAYDLAIENNRIFVADGYDGLEVLETTFPLETKNNSAWIYIISTLGPVVILTPVLVIIVYKKRKR
ncbi:MAG: LVIVD repeat-containing protein [Candidatus Thorarchaeota archaeon]